MSVFCYPVRYGIRSTHMVLSSSSQRRKRKSYYRWGYVAFSAFIVVITYLFWPSVIPFSLFQLWGIHGSLLTFIEVSVVRLLIGTLLFGLITWLRRKKIDWEAAFVSPKQYLKAESVNSLAAGIGEELAFRWLFFLSAISLYTLSGWLFFGAWGFSIEQWLFQHGAGPFVDFITFRQLHQPLYGFGWAVGAAIITVNGRFRDEHSFKGPIGWASAWVGGMFYYYCLFEFGLPAAIVLHTMYDLYVDGLRALAIAKRRRKQR